MDNTNIILDFEISSEQLAMLQIHNVLKDRRVFKAIKEDVKYNNLKFDKLQVWFSCYYNDSNHDVTPIYADIIVDDKIIKKVQLSNYSYDISIDGCPLDSKEMLSYTINENML